MFSEDVVVAFAVCTAAGLATTVGSLLIFRADRTDPHLLALALAFSGGAMVYVSLVEIFAKSVAALGEAHGDRAGYGAATLALFVGIGMIVLIDRLIPEPHPEIALGSHQARDAIARVSLLSALAITAHNFPEGLATFFATLDDPVVGSSLAIAIALHNIPEGVAIAVPVFYATGSRAMAVLASLGSGLAEPVGAFLGYLILAPFLSPSLFGAVFGVIAGAMVYLALEELLPAAKRYAQGRETAFSMVAGMAVLALSLVLFR